MPPGFPVRKRTQRLPGSLRLDLMSQYVSGLRVEGRLGDAGTAFSHGLGLGFQDPAVPPLACPASFSKERAGLEPAGVLCPLPLKISLWVCLCPINPALHHPSPTTDQRPLGSSLFSEKENQGPGEKRAPMSRVALGVNLLRLRAHLACSVGTMFCRWRVKRWVLITPHQPASAQPLSLWG